MVTDTRGGVEVRRTDLGRVQVWTDFVGFLCGLVSVFLGKTLGSTVACYWCCRVLDYSKKKTPQLRGVLLA